MGEEAPPPAMMPSSPSLTSATSAGVTASSAVRFLGILEPPDSDPNLLELDESDVVWAPLRDLSSGSPSAADSITSFDPFPDYAASVNHHRLPEDHRAFARAKFGLSAALSEEPGPLIQQRKAHLARSFSATTAARPVPVSLPKSGSGLGSEYPSSGSRKLFHLSAPVNVPAWPRNGLVRRPALEEVGDGDEVEDDDGDEEMLPPHVIVARSQATTFSVFEGVGRTLKGRDLRRVRNAVFRQTGFLD